VLLHSFTSLKVEEANHVGGKKKLRFDFGEGGFSGGPIIGSESPTGMDYRRSRNDSHLRVPPLHPVHKYLSTSLSRNKGISRGIRFCSISDQIRWTAHQCGKAMISASAFKRGNVIPKSRSHHKLTSFCLDTSKQ